MKRTYVVLLFICIFMCTLMLPGCRKDSGNHDQKPPVHSEGDKMTSTPLPDDNENDETTNIINGSDYKLITIRFYTVNPDTCSVKTATAMELENTNITPERVMDYLIEALEDESITLGVESIVFENNKCIVSFNDSIYMIAGKNANLENAILDAAAQSILDNVKGCESIIFRINGEAYVTANNSFGIDDVYMDN